MENHPFIELFSLIFTIQLLSTPFMETPILSYNLGVALLKNPPAGAAGCPVVAAVASSADGHAAGPVLTRREVSGDLRDEKPIKVMKTMENHGKIMGKKHRKPSNSTENQGTLRNIIQKINERIESHRTSKEDAKSIIASSINHPLFGHPTFGKVLKTSSFRLSDYCLYGFYDIIL